MLHMCRSAGSISQQRFCPEVVIPLPEIIQSLVHTQDTSLRPNV
jgi:hypothetical protein